jgi:hypothetical protein
LDSRPVRDRAGITQEQFTSLRPDLEADLIEDFKRIEEVATEGAGRKCEMINLLEQRAQILDDSTFRNRACDAVSGVGVLWSIIRLETGAIVTDRRPFLSFRSSSRGLYAESLRGE